WAATTLRSNRDSDDIWFPKTMATRHPPGGYRRGGIGDPRVSAGQTVVKKLRLIKWPYWAPALYRPLLLVSGLPVLYQGTPFFPHLSLVFGGEGHVLAELLHPLERFAGVD